MHILQKKLLQLISSRNIANLKLREIGELIGEKHPQKVKHHLSQLKEKGLIIHNKSRNILAKIDLKNNKNKRLVNIPILGNASCGSASIYADENLEGYLKVSTKILKPKEKLFAIKAIGPSMNKAKINGKNIENDDYVVIDVENKNLGNGDYVLSIIDGCCNIKKFVRDNKNKQIILLSESTQDFPPIYIHPHETSYFINGKVVDVIKSY